MKRGCLFAALVLALLVPAGARAQAAVYGLFSVSDLKNLTSTDILSGATAGVLLDGPMIRNKVLLQADIQGRFVFKSGEKLNGVTVGPRFVLPLKHFSPYGEAMIGFARYNSTVANSANGVISTTDATLQFNGGVARRITPRLDAVLDYSYAQYYAFGGEYNPKTFSAGVIYHFTKR